MPPIFGVKLGVALADFIADILEDRAVKRYESRNASSTQRDILEQILLHYPKRLARWIATHCPERLLPNKESAGVLDALDR